jgi:hypothetical protein
MAPATRAALRRSTAPVDASASPPRARRPRRSLSPLGAVDPAARWLYEPHTLTGLAVGEERGREREK